LPTRYIRTFRILTGAFQMEDYLCYSNNGVIGGHQYDITKWTKAEKKRMALGSGGAFGGRIDFFDSDEEGIEYDFV